MSKIIIDSNGRPYMDQNGRVLTVDASIDSNIQAGNIKNGVTIMGVPGTLIEGKPEETFSENITANGQRTITPSSGKVFSGGTINVNVQPSLQSKSVSPSKSQQNVSPDSGYYGLSGVTVGAVTSAIDSNIQQGNIKKGVTILGVTGNYEGEGGGDVIQTNLSMKTVAKTSLTATGLSITVAQSGTYRISWAAFRSYSSGTFSTRVYVGGSAQGTDHTTWTNSYGQQVTETGIALTAGQVVEVYARSSSTSRYTGVMNLVIEKTA